MEHADLVVRESGRPVLLPWWSRHDGHAMDEDRSLGPFQLAEQDRDAGRAREARFGVGWNSGNLQQEEEHSVWSGLGRLVERRSVPTGRTKVSAILPWSSRAGRWSLWGRRSVFLVRTDVHAGLPPCAVHGGDCAMERRWEDGLCLIVLTSLSPCPSSARNPCA